MSARQLAALASAEGGERPGEQSPWQGRPVRGTPPASPSWGRDAAWGASPPEAAAPGETGSSSLPGSYLSWEKQRNILYL